MMKKLLPVSNDIMNDAGRVCKNKFIFWRKKTEAQRKFSDYLSYKYPSKRRRKSCIAPKVHIDTAGFG